MSFSITVFCANLYATDNYQKVKNTEAQHIKRDADMAMEVKPIKHLNTHAAIKKKKNNFVIPCVLEKMVKRVGET